MLTTYKGYLAALKEQLADYMSKLTKATVQIERINMITENLRLKADPELVADLESELVDYTGAKNHWTKRCDEIENEIEFIEKNGYPSWVRLEDLQRAVTPSRKKRA